MTDAPLRIATAVFAIVPLVTGVVSLAGGANALADAADKPMLSIIDSNIRFHGGMWFIAGLALLACAYDLRGRHELFQFIWLMIFAGGIGRLISGRARRRAPPPPMVAAIVIELLGAPLFVWWHAAVARGGV